MILEFVLLVITFLLAVLLLQRHVNSHGDKELQNGDSASPTLPQFPGPLCLPILGALFQFAYAKIKFGHLPQHERAHGLCEMYGKTCQGWAGGLNVLITEDYEVAKEIFHSPDFNGRFTSHPRWRELTFNKNVGLFVGSDEPWRAVRKYTARALHMYGFGEVKTAEVHIDEELQHFFAKMDMDRRREGDEIFVRKYFKVCTFNSIWRLLSGERFEYSDPRIYKIIEDVEMGTDMEIGFNTEWVFPSLRYVPGFSTCWQHCKALMRVQEFLRDLMEKRRKSGSYKKDPPENYIDHFLQKLDEEQAKDPETHFSDEQFIQTACDLLCASIDTTSNAAEFAVLYLLRNPHVMAKLVAEIDLVAGTDVRRVPTHDDSLRMPYTRAFLLEVFRNANLLPLMGRSPTNCDTVVKGHHVPRDIMVCINLAFIHMDPEVWGDPENFRPERFLAADGVTIVNEDKLLAFGVGKRKCLGTTMAKEVLFKITTSLLQRYEFSRSKEHPKLSPRPITGLTNGVTPFHCVVKRRGAGMRANGAPHATIFKI